MPDDAACEVTRDALLGGRLHILQPRSGHRAGTDAVLLASAVEAGFAGRVVDVGAGTGLVGLALAASCPQAKVTLLELEPTAAHLARENASANGLAARVEIVEADLFDPAARLARPPADLVVSNPPFYEASRVRAAPDARRRAAHVLADGRRLGDWVRACHDLLAAKGELVVVAPAAALPDILAALPGDVGGVRVKCVHPRVGAAAHRVLVRARRGSRAPFAIAPALVLHEGDAFTPEAAALHRGEARLAW